MNKNIEVELTAQGLQKLKQKISRWKQELNKASKDITASIAEYTLSEIQKNYASSGVEDSTPMEFYELGSANEKVVGMRGQQAIYDEFGTGTKGALSPHPAKGQFSLNAYNSGPTIRTSKRDIITDTGDVIPEGVLYWTYKDENGNKKYTQGIPAQKEVYNAYQSASKKAESIAIKRLEKVFK